jgi:peroxiredoxin
MARSACLLGSVLVLAGLFGLAGALRAQTAQPARNVRTFTLKDAADRPWSLKDLADRKAIVVVFLGTECPINNAYLPRLAELSGTYGPKGVAFVAVNSNWHDTSTRIAAHAKSNALPFPVLKDTANVVADDFGARRTPEVFVISPAGTILYQGRIDDRIGIGFKRKEPTRNDLAVALDEVLAGKPVSVAKTEAAGCLIARALPAKKDGSITFARDISPLLQKNCQECHRPGQVGPMPLLTYEDALAWSGMIQEVVQDGRMPPWHADPRFGKFSNDRTLSKAERETLLAWVKQGCPEGDPKQAPLPRAFPKGWTIGTPDVVFEMPVEAKVPASTDERGLRYQYFFVKTDFPEDRWVQAAEARPGAREVVHHIIVYVVDPAKVRLGGIQRDRRDGIGDGFLAAYAPGDMPLVLKPGQAKKLPKGAGLAFQMHYTPDGIERRDRSSVGLIFAKEPPRAEVRTRSIAYRGISIPPGDSNHEVLSRTTFDRDVELISFLPHMHLRGKDFKYEVVYPDGKKETLLSVPRYDFTDNGLCKVNRRQSA